MNTLSRDQVKVSRRISMVLRHRPESAGLTLDANGCALVVGRRRLGDVVVFEVDAARMAADGHVFHRSENGVWLTLAAPSGYLSLKRTNQ